ncbi:hypothetical protein AMECASPLE_033965 [Ameca splendens]|uniref:Secreted protein n=1 Tax=Ameca splendens TaxID=208324 RepID=A0ABV0ZH42_9TELE
MGTAWFAVCGVLFVAFLVVAAEESSCVPGFESELLLFRVTGKHLRQGTRLGKVLLIMLFTFRHHETKTTPNN